jgi:predicted O-methyltransferase YrrM
VLNLPQPVERRLRDLAEYGRAHDAGEPRHAHRLLNLDWPTAEALFLMVRMARRRSVLEIGTSNGFSTLWLAQALAPQAGARLVTIERDPAKSRQARANLEQVGLAGPVAFLVGQATPLVEGLDEVFDSVFFDADRVSAPEQFARLLPKLTPDAILFSDNALSHPEEIAGYLDCVDRSGQFDSTLLPVGKGLHVAVRRQARG